MTNVSAAESGDHQATHQRQGATDCHEYWQARSATCWPTCTLAHTQAGCGEPVEEQWETCRGSQKKHGVIFIWSHRAEERGVCRLVDTALSFKSFRTVLG